MLSQIIFWAMKENLSIQFIYPQESVPESVERIVESIDHTKIVPDSCENKELLAQADIIVTQNLETLDIVPDKIYVVRTALALLSRCVPTLKGLIRCAKKVNVVFTDVDRFNKADISSYRAFLHEMAEFIADSYLADNPVQLNLITDRMMLDSMNNCNAGHESIAVSTDGLFYPCPAFIGDSRYACGNIHEGMKGPNLQLYCKSNAPICKICDAYHCKRCVWLNRALTNEVNTPGWQQCYMAHLEREASMTALEKIRMTSPDFLAGKSIPHIDYLDPFSIIEKI